LAGYTGTEVGTKYPKDAQVLKKALEIRGLKVCNWWFSSFLTTEPFAEVAKAFTLHIEFLAAVGAPIVGVGEHGNAIVRAPLPVFDEKPAFNEEQWKRLSDGLNRLGELAREQGLQLAFHHHMGTGIQTAEEIDRLMHSTEPGLCDLVYDTGHLVFSGEDHLAVLEKWAHRVRHVHLKDVRPEVLGLSRQEKLSFLEAVKKGAFTVPGDGCIDFVPVVRALVEAGYAGWWVVEAEQDPKVADPLEYAMRGRAYLRAKLGL
jgi:inosose dehydratase